MDISEIMMKMIIMTGSERRSVSHFMKVHSFARTIGLCEHLDPETQYILEAAAVIHDIACPVCRAKYGSAPGHLQEAESSLLVREFFKDTDLTDAQTERIEWLVCHHHTYDPVCGIDHRILLEADYLVNADEGKHTPEKIAAMKESVFRTATGTALLESLFRKGQTYE